MEIRDGVHISNHICPRCNKFLRPFIKKKRLGLSVNDIYYSCTRAGRCCVWKKPPLGKPFWACNYKTKIRQDVIFTNIRYDLDVTRARFVATCANCNEVSLKTQVVLVGDGDYDYRLYCNLCCALFKI